MHCVLDERLGVPVPLEDDALGLIVVEVNVVLHRAGVLGPHDLHALSGQALELLELALVKLELSDAPEAHSPLRPPDFCVAGSDRLTRSAPARCADRSCPALSSAAAPSSRIG